MTLTRRFWRVPFPGDREKFRPGGPREVRGGGELSSGRIRPREAYTMESEIDPE